MPEVVPWCKPWRIINTMASKRTVMIGAVGGMIIGGVLPFLWGDYNSFDLTNVLTTTIGGFVGIWLAVWLGKHIDI